MKSLDKLIVFIIVLFILIAGITFAESPFGLEMGMTFEEIKTNTGKIPTLHHNDFYNVDPLPQYKDDRFLSYNVQMNPKHGTVMIRAIGKNIRTDKYGHELIKVFMNMLDELKREYGEFSSLGLSRKELLKESEGFMRRLLINEIHLEFELNRNEATKYAYISKISIKAVADSQSTGHIVLEYHSSKRNTEINSLISEVGP
ncbi:hypothetical protein FACS1894137_02750 [Spirochaetia bacterium]|nr:hypothetical protein FACS1894137_02750 [Spirochaetia bacterium]